MHTRTVRKSRKVDVMQQIIPVKPPDDIKVMRVSDCSIKCITLLSVSIPELVFDLQER